MTTPRYRFFLAGIMQGSWKDRSLHRQDYRDHLAALLQNHFHEAEIYDPLRGHASSIQYDEATGRRVFFTHNLMCRNDIDVLVAFAPEASMGTAIEMWEAYQSGAVVLTISPMAHNWTVRFLSHEVFSTVADFELAIRDGRVGDRMATVLANGRRNPVEDALRPGKLTSGQMR